MAKNKLTATAIRKSTGKLFDGGGLYLNKSKPESWLWSYRYKHQGRAREMGLGAFPTLSLADARQERDKWEAVLRSGQDPIPARERERADIESANNKDDPTFADMAQAAFEAKKAGLRRDGASGKWFSPLRLYMIPAIGKKRMSQIHQADIVAALKPIWRTKHPTAEKAVQRTMIIFEHAKLSGCDCDPFIVNMAQHMLGEVRHKVTPTPASDWRDIPRIYEALNLPTASHWALRFAILTAVRSAGVRGATFAEIDGDVWTVPAERMKGREGQVEDFRVPLSAEAMRVVDEARALARNDFLFPGERAGGISEVAFNKVFKKIDPNGTPHGLRSSFSTWVEETDAAAYDVRETALAHIFKRKVERAYARSDLLDRRRTSMEAWAAHATGAASAKVVSIS